MAHDSNFPIPVKLAIQTVVKVTTGSGEELALAGELLLITEDQSRQVTAAVRAFEGLDTWLQKGESMKSGTLEYSNDYAAAKRAMRAAIAVLADGWNIPREG